MEKITAVYAEYMTNYDTDLVCGVTLTKGDQKKRIALMVEATRRRNTLWDKVREAFGREPVYVSCGIGKNAAKAIKAIVEGINAIQE